MSRLAGPSEAEPHPGAGEELFRGEVIGLGKDVVAEGAPRKLEGDLLHAGQANRILASHTS